MEKQFIDENKYQKTKKRLIIAAIAIITTTLVISGVFFLVPGFSKYNVSDQYRQDFRTKEVDLELRKDVVSHNSKDYYALQDESNMLQNTSPQRMQSEATQDIFIGFFIIWMGVFVISGGLLYMAFGRNFAAFGAQTTVPVVKEVIEDVAPSFRANNKEKK